MLRLIITAIIFYLVFKFVRNLAYAMSSVTHKSNQTSTSSKPQNSARPSANSKIDKKDIVEAEFVEIKNSEK